MPTETIIVRHVPDTDPPQFTVERHADGRAAPPVAVAPPNSVPVEGRPNARLTDELRWYLETFLDFPFPPEDEHAGRVWRAVDLWGRQTFTTLFAHPHARRSYERAVAAGFANLTLRIVSDSPTIHGWPWEALHDPETDPLAHHCELERRVDTGRDPAPLKGLPTDRVNVLLVIARPLEGDVRYRSVSRSLVELAAGHTFPIAVDVLRPPTFDQLREHLKQHPNHYHNRDSYTYFGNPLYTYSLKQGIEDGFLAPYRVHRIVTSFDAAGWRPNKGQKDKHGHEIPDRLYTTKDFERVVSVDARNKIVAKHINDFLRSTDRYAKTIVFCVDQEHAGIMRQELHSLNLDLAAEAAARGTEYAARVVSDEGDRGKGFLDQFQDPEEPFPVILTTSQLLTTGVDAPTCKNVVLFRMVNSMTEFKQIIGRGTRLREDHGKLYFHILDYNGSANERFSDPAFDGEPALATQEEIDAAGNVTVVEVHTDPEQNEDEGSGVILDDPPEPGARKFRVHGGLGGIAYVDTHDLSADGTKLRTANLTAFTGGEVRGLAPDVAALRAMWSKPAERDALLKALDDRGIDLHVLAAEAGQPDADPFDLLARLAYNAPLQTRAERAAKLRSAHTAFLATFAPPARGVLNAILDKYTAHGVGQFNLEAVLQVKPLSDFGTVTEIAARFGGADKLLDAVDRLQELLYAN